MNKAILLFIFFIPQLVFSQVKVIGTPAIQNYPKSAYKGGTQNWGIAQDKNGFIYFANNDGLLRFDGIHWELTKASTTSPVRSVFVDSGNNIYLGLINDFGILKQTENGVPVFESLKHLLPLEVADFDDIWRIHEISDGIVFECFQYLFILKNNKITLIKPQKSFHFSFNVQNQLYVQELGIGLFEYKDGKMNKLLWSEMLKDYEISVVLGLNENQLLIGTLGNGIFKVSEGRIDNWKTPVSDQVEKYKLYSAVPLRDNIFAFGTILNGLIICDVNGNILQEINRRHGIQNNTVLSTFYDKNENLWLGLDNGIDFVEVNSPITFINNLENIGTGYCARVFKGNLYLGTNQGLFVRPFNNLKFSDQSFELIKNSGGQVWSLDIFDGHLICGHNLGTFLVEGNSITKIGNERGIWKYIQLKNNPEFLLGGCYNGLVLLKKEKNGWSFYSKVGGFGESSRYLKQDRDGTIWVSHGEKGVFRISLSENLDSVKNMKLYISVNGLPSDKNNKIFDFKNQVYVSGNGGIYQYEKSSDSFKIAEELNKLFTTVGRIKTLETDNDGNIWFIAENESGVLRLNEDLSYTEITSPFKKLYERYVNEFEFIYPFNDENIFIGIDNGFAHYSSKFPKAYNQPFNSYLTKIELPYIDSVLYLNAVRNSLKYEFPFRKNEFRIHFTAPFFENTDPLEFTFLLENFSQNWSEWSTDSYKDFPNLREGRYVFHLKARNVYGTESEESAFEFSILPPWYRSSLAYYFYVLFFLVFVFGFIRFIQFRIKLARQKEEKKHKKELRKREIQFQHQSVIAEREIVNLKNEKLQAEMIYRDKELANQTMGIIQKNRFLTKINEELRLLQNSTQDAAVRNKISSLKRKIKKETDDDSQNKIFEAYFEEVHEEFFKRLLEKYPQLSPADLRLCAYIKMNISTKEISTLLNISYRGVEISRYRLRKKLDLSRDINFPAFLLNF